MILFFVLLVVLICSANHLFTLESLIQILIYSISKHKRETTRKNKKKILSDTEAQTVGFELGHLEKKERAWKKRMQSLVCNEF